MSWGFSFKNKSGPKNTAWDAGDAVRIVIRFSSTNKDFAANVPIFGNEIIKAYLVFRYSQLDYGSKSNENLTVVYWLDGRELWSLQAR